ncbi:MAG: hypothetical protein AAF696_37510 [Bacteroidota bacterium]
MSRSKKKSKFHGVTKAKSEKMDKREANRRFRRILKQKVDNGEEILPEARELSDVWAFAKDGKVYDRTMNEKDLRK